VKKKGTRRFTFCPTFTVVWRRVSSSAGFGALRLYILRSPPKACSVTFSTVCSVALIALGSRCRYLLPTGLALRTSTPVLCYRGDFAKRCCWWRLTCRRNWCEGRTNVNGRRRQRAGVGDGGGAGVGDAWRTAGRARHAATAFSASVVLQQRIMPLRVAGAAAILLCGICWRYNHTITSYAFSLSTTRVTREGFA